MKAPKVGPDENNSMQIAGKPGGMMNLPDRDGPARDKPQGANAPKKKTAAKAKVSKKQLASMKASIKGMA